jgi:alginate O-acetyltransferase complex protein AlgI
MVVCVVINYVGGLIIEKNRNYNDKVKFIFITLIVIDISVLFFFKYYGFLIDNINGILGISLKMKKLALPLGISFYTFKIISYICDVYTNKARAQKNIINFGVYVAMFPQLISGPISKYSNMERQLDSRKESLIAFGKGVERFILGLGKKIIIANNLGLIWTQIKATDINSLSITSAWIGIIFYTLQIYFDFSGYSDMAIGLGYMIGFETKENFDYPYISKSITEFWRRWHISLGNWFRDYIYIPLGGNRKGKLVQFRNIFIVWFTTGLWHGASWNFIIWGLYFGVFIVVEKLFLYKMLNKIPSILCNIYTMILVSIGWVLFDMDSLSKAITYIKIMFGIGNNPVTDNLSMYIISTNMVILIIAILGCVPLVRSLLDFKKRKLQFIGTLIAVTLEILVLIVSISYLINESYTPFLYFKF